MGFGSELRCAVAANERGWIDGEQLAEACALWSADKAVPIGRLLVDLGWIDAAQRAELEEPSVVEPWTVEGTVAATRAEEVPSGPELTQAAEADPTGGAAAGAIEVPAATLADDGAPALSDVPGQEATVAGFAGSGVEGTVAATVVAPGPAPWDLQTVEGDGPSGGGSPPPAGHVLLSAIGANDPRTRERYTLTRLHAKGGIGQVWLARDSDLGREVALKELRLGPSGNKNAWSRFVEEARITGQLEHPGIVPVYELKNQGASEKPFYTMRFVRGGTLHEAIAAYHRKRSQGQAGPLERSSLLDAFVDVCNTLAYAHSRGVIHRDLKGQNIVMGDYGEVMVLDWGLAKLIDPPAGSEATPSAPAVRLDDDSAAHNPTLQGQVQGTPAYMAPEQAEGRIDAIDARTDVYGLGAILYEILAGKPPFSGMSTAEILRRVREDAPPRPRLVAPDSPPALEAICLKALAKRPEDRYQKASDLALDVRRWLADEPVSVYREPAVVRLGRWARRHRTAVASTAALLLTAVFALSVSTVLVRRERDEARRQRQQARLAVDDMYSQVADKWLEDRLDPLQREFLAKALAYYERFTIQDGSDPAVVEDRGRASLRMGDVLRKLGRHDEAEGAYRKSIAVLEGLARDLPRIPSYRRHLATALAHLADSLTARGRYPEAESLYREAGERGRFLVDEGTDPADRLALARTERGLGELLRVNGRSKEAMEAIDRAVGLLLPIATLESAEAAHRRELAAASEVKGLLLREGNRPDEAAAAYRRAVGLLERLTAEAPTQPQFRAGLSRAYNSLGLLAREAGRAEEAESLLRREVALQERLVADFPDRPDDRRALARGLINLGILLQERGETKEAESTYRRALPIVERLAGEFPDVLNYRRDLARTLSNLGSLSAASGRAEAEPLCRRAMDVYGKLVEDAPTVPDHRHALANTLKILADWLGATGKEQEAELSYRKGLAILDALTTAHPDNPDYPRSGADCLGNLGNLLAAGQRHKEAEDAYARAAGRLEAMVAKTSAAADRFSLAQCLSNRGDNLRVGKLPGAESTFRRAVDLFERLVADSPGTPSYRRGAAVVQVNRGEWLAADGRPRDAEAAFGQAIDLLGALAGDLPTVSDYQSNLGYALAALAGLRVDEKRPGEARPLLERAVASQRAALKIAPKDPAVRQLLGDHLAALAGVALDLGAYDAASVAADELVRLSPDNPGVRVKAARLLARCAPLVGSDAKLQGDRREALAGAFADRAIGLLREAIERGEPGVVRALQDAEFAPLKSRDAFRTLPFLGALKGARVMN